MKRLALTLMLLGASCANLTLPEQASAAVATTKVTLNFSTWTDLGVGPLQLNAGGSQAVYVMSDTAPALPVGQGFAIPTNTNQIANAIAPTHVYASAASPSAAFVWVSAVTIASGGSGGGGGAITGPFGSSTIDAGSVAITASTQSVFGALGDVFCPAYNTPSCSQNALLRLIAKGGTGGGGGGAITAPLGPGTAPAAAISITDTGAPITGQSLLSGGQGLTGWFSQLYAAANAGVFTSLGTAPVSGVGVGGIRADGKPDFLQVEQCSYSKSFADIMTTTSPAQIVLGVAGQKVRVCGATIITSTAANVALMEGSAPTCGAAQAAVFLNPGVTAANGGAFGANGGTNTGYANSTVAQTATAGNSLCVLFNTTNSPQVNVHVAYVQAP